MKGFQLATVLIIGALLLFLTIGPAVKTASLEAVRRSAVFQAEYIANIINFLQSAPVTTQYALTTAKGSCTMLFNQMYVELTLENLTARSDILQTGLEIPKKEIKCSAERQKTVCFVRRQSSIDIFESEVNCILTA
ncbi:MAG: hypothetical protein HY518_00345 [Candidatus Aenigmarchaeota archaeon]|nr:hypothetical protein [Candidatus Aenigmarchaeota archaeon]